MSERSRLMEEALALSRKEETRWDAPSSSEAAAPPPTGSPGSPPPRDLPAWLGSRFDRAVARLVDFSARHRDPPEAGAMALRRTGGALERWSSFPRGARMATAAAAAASACLAGWALLALAGHDLGASAAALGGAAVLLSASGTISVRMASRVHRLIARQRRYRLVDLRALPDRRAVAVRGVVVARQTAASALDGRSAVWSVTRLRRWPWMWTAAGSFFHEVAFDFMVDDGTDEPILIEVKGGMLLDPFPADRRVQFMSTTLLEIDHPFLTRLRLGGRMASAAEVNIAAGDVVEVVGRLCHRLDPSAPAESTREPPRRRALRGGLRVPVMVRRVAVPDAGLARVRRLLPKGPPSSSAGEPPIRRF